MAEERLLPNWLNAYRAYTDESEAPDSFHFWVGMSILASVVRRNVRLDMGIFPVFPNLYTVLVSPQGKIGKSTNIRLGRELLSRVDGVVMGPDSCTREELIQAFTGAERTHESAITIHSSEMSSFIDPSGITMIQFLTDIYDTPNVWRYDTKGAGKFTITLPVLNILCGTTPEWIADGLPEAAVRGGFAGRTIFVYEDQVRKSNPFPSAPNAALIEELVEDLRHIADVSGEFEITPDARRLYVKKYEEWQNHTPLDHRMEGYHNRKRIHVLKVAMLLSLSQSDNLTIRTRDLQAAIDILESTEIKMSRTFAAMGKWEHSAIMERIINWMLENGGKTTLQEVIRAHYREASREDLMSVLHSGLGTGWLTREHLGGDEWVFHLTKDAVRHFQALRRPGADIRWE